MGLLDGLLGLTGTSCTAVQAYVDSSLTPVQKDAIRTSKVTIGNVTVGDLFNTIITKQDVCTALIRCQDKVGSVIDALVKNDMNSITNLAKEQCVKDILNEIIKVYASNPDVVNHINVLKGRISGMPTSSYSGGTTGTTGTTPSTGTTGTTGTTPSTGTTTTTGVTGATGSRGVAGSAGPAGAAGSTGATGAGGATGAAAGAATTVINNYLTNPSNTSNVPYDKLVNAQVLFLMFICVTTLIVLKGVDLISYPFLFISLVIVFGFGILAYYMFGMSISGFRNHAAPYESTSFTFLQNMILLFALLTLSIYVASKGKYTSTSTGLLYSIAIVSVIAATMIKDRSFTTDYFVNHMY